LINSDHSLLDLDKEVWKDIPGFEGRYQASTLGRIKSLSRYALFKRCGRLVKKKISGSVLKPLLNKQKGYYYVSLGRGFKKPIHRFVALTFLGPPNGLCVNHKNLNKLDNSLSNLEYLTSKENIIHACEKGAFNNLKKNFSKKYRGQGNPNSKLSESDILVILKLLDKNVSRLVLSTIFRVTPECISGIKHKKTWKHLSYKID
jgi:hypothetical protein